MRPALRRSWLPAAVALGALALAACGGEGIALSEDDPSYEGAVLFAERCAGCHTLEAAGAQGSGDQTLRVQGPDLDARRVSEDEALCAIRNGGFSGAIMPQNIVVGEDADTVARFLAEHSGAEVDGAPEEPDPTEEATCP